MQLAWSIRVELKLCFVFPAVRWFSKGPFRLLFSFLGPKDSFKSCSSWLNSIPPSIGLRACTLFPSWTSASGYRPSEFPAMGLPPFSSSVSNSASHFWLPLLWWTRENAQLLRGSSVATGRPGVLRFMGSQRVGHDRAEEGLHRAWTPSQACPCWSRSAASPVDSALWVQCLWDDNRRIRPSPDRGALKIISRLLLT